MAKQHKSRLKYKKKTNRVEWVRASDIKRRVDSLIKILDINWVKNSRIFCFRSRNTKTAAIARIWGFSRIWQDALGEPPAYIIEVVSEKFDRLSEVEKNKILLHEINHIPKNFSGSLVPHIRRGKRSFHKKLDDLISRYLLLTKNGF